MRIHVTLPEDLVEMIPLLARRQSAKVVLPEEGQSRMRAKKNGERDRGKVRKE